MPAASWSGAGLGAWSTAAANIHTRLQTAPANWSGDVMVPGCPWLVMIWSQAVSAGDSWNPGELLATYCSGVMARAPSKLLGSGANGGFPLVATVPISGIAHRGWKPWAWDCLVMFWVSLMSLSIVAVVTPSLLNLSTACSIAAGEAKAEGQPRSARSMALEGTPTACRSASIAWFTSGWQSE